MRPPLIRLLLLIALLALGGCGTAGPPPGGISQAARDATPDAVWHRVRFYIHWDRTAAPAWHLDALLAHRIASPQLAQERKSIVLWRFHRRAVDDATGHSLSLLTYAPGTVNSTICSSIRADRFIEKMIRENLLDKVECETFPSDREHLVEATSDPRWSLAIQRTWPHYIMGASEMWLRLIEEHLPQAAGDKPEETIGEIVTRYETAHSKLTENWQQEGKHALLHHLNGIFAYEPMQLTDKEWRRF